MEEFLFQTLNIEEFHFEKFGSLIMRPTESNGGILFTTTNEPIIDTWCELALGKNGFSTLQKWTISCQVMRYEMKLYIVEWSNDHEIDV